MAKLSLVLQIYLWIWKSEKKNFHLVCRALYYAKFYTILWAYALDTHLQKSTFANTTSILLTDDAIYQQTQQVSGAPCLLLWGVISNTIADTCNSLIHNPCWDHFYTYIIKHFSQQLSKIWGYLCGGNGMNVLPYPHPQLFKVFEHLIYVCHRCGMQFERSSISVNSIISGPELLRWLTFLRPSF